jgi:hypothetical protein
MRSGFKLVAAVVATTGLLMGCAGARYDEVATKYAGLPPNAGRIYFYQQAQTNNSISAQPYLRINGWKTGRSKPDTFFFVNRPAGEYTISTRSGNPGPITVTLAAGQTRYIRLSIESATGNVSGVGEQIMREEVSETKAREEMASMRFWGAGSRERKQLSKTYPLQ